MTAFSDAVVSIAITLLALELPVPSGSTSAEFWSSVREGGEEYLAFAISFVVIALMWSLHHHVFRYVGRSDSRLRTLNMAWLFTIILNPFATKLLTTQSGDANAVHAVRWSFYALLQVLAAATFLAMMRHSERSGLLDPDTPPGLIEQSRRRSLATMSGFLISIPGSS